MRISILFLAVLFVGCSSTESNNDLNQVENNPEVQPALQQNKEVTPDGPFKSHYPDGKLKMEGVITAGHRDGAWTSYHPNGIKASENHYVLGQLTGKTTAWHDNGLLFYIGYYKNGNKVGKWIFFDKNGEPVSEETY
jgi:antitoxin component YwqK of YwqJK toxin-antitoxin module